MNELPADKVKPAWIEWTKEKLDKTTDLFVKERLGTYLGARRKSTART
ncbi:MAG: hypothetical protein U0792_24955 [Gemmataceae bacterium]